MMMMISATMSCNFSHQFAVSHNIRIRLRLSSFRKREQFKTYDSFKL